ncbi:hypothetical protein HLB23_38990 [Nocardia uniformis]|uniref:DUF2231 domain-containing protein n=1 Tax=Nocardia uniformis TaxID=53432 RepID=A0A849CAA6_9NOCA|nr:DUF2231 domain-containing protein [Nocardia uniformis]NNH75773.1 hypothetical protein [Nocardia uniformis]
MYLSGPALSGPTTFNGLPAHVLLVHALVVLVPLTAALLIVSAVWAAARRRLVWLTAVLAAVVVALTPLTTEAGEWLAQRVGSTPEVEKHIELGGSTLYFVIPLLVVAVLLLLWHWREQRGATVGKGVVSIFIVLAIVAGVAASVHIYRVGDSGTRAVWGGITAV